MLSSQWVCKRCGRVGGFTCYGVGFIRCSGCGSLHIVTASGELQLCRFIKAYEGES